MDEKEKAAAETATSDEAKQTSDEERCTSDHYLRGNTFRQVDRVANPIQQA